MFDGNHRERKDINLSRGNRRRQRAGAPRNFLGGGKAQVLEDSRRQREERKLQQLKQSSSKTIQRFVRGWKTRRSVLLELQSMTQKDGLTTLQLSMLLSLTNDYRDALIQYARQLPLQKQEIVSSVSKQRILQSALKELATAEANQQPQVMHLLQYFFEEQDRNPVSMTTYLVLVHTCQQCMLADDGTHTQILDTLWRFACQAAATIQTKLSLAYLAATLFGYASVQHQAVAATYFGEAQDVHRWNYQVLLDAMMDSQKDATLHRMLKDRESKVVLRAMELYESLESPNPHALLQLLESLLPKHTVLTSLLIRGENVRSIVLEGKSAEEVKQQVDDDSDEEDENDDDAATTNENNKRHRKATASVSVSASTSRLTRQQVQTVPRLNQLYQDEWSRLRNETLSTLKTKSLAHRTNAVELAEQLGNATLWQTWGIAVLGQESSSSRRAYLRLLGRLLQGCSGYKTSTTSPFLSQLAFSRPFLEALWRQTLVLLVNGDQDEELTAMTTILFCDVFSHHLISLSDKDFSASYTTANPNPTIFVEHVVSNIKNILHDLYWDHPVVAVDVRLGLDLTSLRARLLLSGTKLWNSLYERWTRLVRQAPFCDESSWWFPRLASRDDNAAVIGSREPNRSQNDDDVEDMDVDDSDDDSAEEEVNEAELENDALADTFRDPKMARVLTSIPQALPFDRRVKLFNSLLNADKIKTQDESADFRRAVARMIQRGGDEDMEFTARERVEIRRDALYSDSMNQLNQLGGRLKRKVQVTMVNKHGAQEAGIDGGGVFKEFLDDLIKEAFDPDANGNTHRLFSVTPLQTLAVNMDLAAKKEILSHYEFLGRVLGKAVYESILVEPQFCLPFLNQLLGKQNSLEDLKNFDLEFYENLTKMRTLSESDIQSMGLTFELNVGTNRVVPLIPGGSNLPVTKQNVIHYIHLVAHQRLNIEGAVQTKAFLRGFRDLVPASWVRLFSAYELQKMISGDDTVRGIDVGNLKAAMLYSGGYFETQDTIQDFWEVIEEMSPDLQRKFLRFMTSCSRQPLLGFQASEPLPCIQKATRVPEELTREEKMKLPLPTSSTCMNLLKLPDYKDKQVLQQKLTAAIEAGAGFELT